MAARKISQLLSDDITALFMRSHPHTIWNAKFTAVNNSTTEQSLGIDSSVSGFDILCAVRKAGGNGDVQWLSTSAPIKITMPTGTWSTPIAGITVTGDYEFYAYVVNDNGTMRFMISRSPFLKAIPANYYHTISATGMTAVGSPQNVGNSAFLSGSGAINATNSVICIGKIGTLTIDGATGLSSGSALVSGAVPTWDYRCEPVFTILTDTKSSGTNGGTFSSGDWRTRTLNTKNADAIGMAYLSSNTITLQAGTYKISARAPGFGVGIHKAKLRNTTDGTDAIIGTSERASQSDSVQSNSAIIGQLVLTAAKTFEVQHRCTDSLADIGFGQPSGYSVDEVYTILEIQQIA